MRASLRNVVAVARVCTCPPSPSLLRCLSVAPRRGAPPSRLPSRAPGGKPSSTDPGFSLDSLIGSSDEEPSSSPARRGAPHERQGAREAYGARSGSYPGSRAADSESSPASTSRSASDTAEEATAESSPPARAPPPTFLGIVDKDGDVVALESEDERHLPFLAPDELSDASKRRAVQQLAYYRRTLRSTHSSEDLEHYALALTRELGTGVLGDDLTALRRPDDLAIGEDPLENAPLPFNVKALEFKMHLSFGAGPGARQIDRRCVLTTTVHRLGLASPDMADYVRAIAGSHYHPASDTIKISIDHHADAALNRREAVERLVAVVVRSGDLVARFGPMVRPKVFPPYAD